MRQFIKVNEIIKIGTTYTVPSYIVGSGQLLFFFNGVLCIQGEGYQYEEIGEHGKESTKIKIYFTLNPNDELTFIVIPIEF